MNVEKVIRVLGYLVYTALWAPVIVLYIVVAPIVCLGMCIRAGRSVKGCIAMLWESLTSGIRHDMAFIRTGQW